MSKPIITVLGVLILAQTVFAAGGPAQNNKAHQPSNPCPTKFPNIDQSCQQICQACFQAGYVVGEWKLGDGFWADCVAPIVTGKPAPKPPTNDGRQLPTLPTGLESTGKTCNEKSGLFWKKK